MNQYFFRFLFQAAFEAALFLFVLLLLLDQWLPNFARLSLRLDFVGWFVVLCGVVYFLLEFKKPSKH